MKYNLFDALAVRVEMHFTEQEFEMFRSRLSHHGITLREVTRFPFTQLESVF